MDAFTSAANAFAALLLACICAWAILSPRVRDGVVIKLGLILMAIGYLVTVAQLADGMDCSDLQGLARSELLTRVGLLIVAAGWLWRHWVKPKFTPEHRS